MAQGQKNLTFSLRSIADTIAAIPKKSLKLQQRIMHDRLVRKLEHFVAVIQLSETETVSPETIMKMQKDVSAEMAEFQKEVGGNETRSKDNGLSMD